MAQSDHELDRLSGLLHALPVETVPMTISELDGYITGVLACPEMIPPSEWLPHVWGETGVADFPDQQAAEATVGAVMAHHNAVADPSCSMSLNTSRRSGRPPLPDEPSDMRQLRHVPDRPEQVRAG